MTLKLVVLCICLQLFSIVAVSSSFRMNDSDIISEDNKSEALGKLEEQSQDVEAGNIRGTEDSKFATDSHDTRKDQSEDLESVWLDVPLLPIAYARSSSLPDGPCKKQAQLYLRHLKNHTLWAAQMFDASTKYPDGILSGNTRHLGDFDLCYNLKTTLSHTDDDDEPMKKEEIAGRYCLVDIKYEKQGLPPVDPLERLDTQFDPQSSVWEAIREKGDCRRVKRYLLQMALCVPEVCSAADIESALQEPFAQFGIKQNMHFNVSVKPKFCQAMTEAPKSSLGTKIYWWVVFGLFLLVAMSTWYDYSLQEYKENEGSMVNDLVLCFSVRRNFNTLMEITSNHPGLDTIHLTRFFYLTLTLVGHRLMEYYAAPTVNASYLEKLYTTRRAMPVLGGPQVVEGFFSIGGLLVSYSLLGQLDATKKFNFLAAIIIRFLRLTPAYALVVFFNIYALPYMGSGPYWKWKIDLERESCANNWWANLLYINNYVNPEQICMFQTWYLSADYHLFILALLVVYAFWRMPRKLGYPFLCLVVLGGCIVPFVNTYWYDVPPMYRGFLYMQEVREDPYFTDHYVKTHERITSYFIGVLTGAVLYDHNRNPWKLSKVVSHISFILFAVVMSLGSQYTGYKYFDPNENHRGLEAALYACLHRGVFAISCCSLAVLVTVGQGLTFHYNFLAPRWVQPLGRITYGAYLTHSIIQLYATSTTRTARQFGIFNMFWNVIPDVAYAFFLALLISLAVEGPFRRIEKRFIMKREKNKISNEMEEEAKKAN